MHPPSTRREFVRDMGLGAASLPFFLNLPSLARSAAPAVKSGKQRLVVLFSPNGVVPGAFWPAEQGEKFTLPESLKPLAPFKSKTDTSR
jgi:hypothetical protein